MVTGGVPIIVRHSKGSIKVQRIKGVNALQLILLKNLPAEFLRWGDDFSSGISGGLL